MKSKFLLACTMLLFFAGAFAQVGISPSGGPPDASSGLDVDFNNRGFLPPRLTTAQRNAIASPAKGLQIYNTDCDVINYNAGTPSSPNWVSVASSNSLPAGVTISSNPVGAVCQGTGITYTAVITNGGNSPTYQWKRNGVDINSETNSTYVDASPLNGDVISCVITSNAPCVTGSPATSNSLTEVVNPTLSASVSIAVNPTGAICAGTSVTFNSTATNSGSSPSYQWKKNSIDIFGATSSSYSSTSLADNDIITCVMTSNLVCVVGSPATSNDITMSVNSVPSTPGSISGAASVCPNSTGNVYSISSVAGATSYNWTVPSGASITLNTGTSITVSFGNTVSGNIAVSATNSCGTSSQNSLSVSQPSFSASGGNVTNSGGYVIHTFTTSGSFVVSGCGGTVEYLIVGGGGGGGDGNAPGGGGGAGGFVEGTTTVTSGSLNVVVGNGGNGGTNDNPGVTGQNSSFNGVIALGGGYGGGYNTSGNGGDGGSGGGGSGPTGSGNGGNTIQTSPPGGTGYGNTGGPCQGSSQSGGGGGGAGGAGTRPTGGAGKASTITGSTVYYAGGGGGAGWQGSAGVGGVGGGGNGGQGGNGVAGTANTGGGGGGSSDATGGAGGSGIVIIRYPQ